MYKIEPHCHTSPASKCGKITVKTLLSLLGERGYNGACITNHYTYYDCVPRANDELMAGLIADWDEACALAPQYGLKLYFGFELRFYENANDYLVYGLTPQELRALGPIYQMTPQSFYEIKPAHALIFQAHPFRSNMVRADTRFLDGIEVYNGHTGHDSHNDLALSWAKEHNMRMLSGSDSHSEGGVDRAGIYVEKLPQDERAFADMLRRGDYKLITPAWDNMSLNV